MRTVRSLTIAFLSVGLLVPGVCSSENVYLKKMPKEGDIPHGKVVYVDDGSVRGRSERGHWWQPSQRRSPQGALREAAEHSASNRKLTSDTRAVRMTDCSWRHR